MLFRSRVGVFRLMKVLDRYGVRGTVALNSDLCVQHPEIIEECKAREWEFMGHNESNTRRLNELRPGRESRTIRSALDTIAKATGSRPLGWLGSGLQETWDTLEFLAAEGCEYVCDWVNDDQPYMMRLESGRRLVSVPYSTEINDKPAFEKRVLLSLCPMNSHLRALHSSMISGCCAHRSLFSAAVPRTP